MSNFDSFLKTVNINVYYTRIKPTHPTITQSSIDSWVRPYYCDLLSYFYETNLIFKDGYDYDKIRIALRKAKEANDLSLIDYLESKLHRIEQSILY